MRHALIHASGPPKRAGNLVKCGFKGADLSNLDKAAADLAQANANQELARKAQVNATEARNKAMKELLQAMAQVRNNAKSVFAGQKDVRREFETIRRVEGGEEGESAVRRRGLVIPWDSGRGHGEHGEGRRTRRKEKG